MWYHKLNWSSNLIMFMIISIFKHIKNYKEFVAKNILAGGNNKV